MSLKVFYCYAHEDKMRRVILEKHLATLKRQGLITEWHDGDINAGKEREKEIDTNMNTADIILLLISSDFVHSDYCYGIGMKRALERHENGIARVVPIILRPGDYKGAPFSMLQSLPTDAPSITDRKWHSRDEAFSNVAQGIRTVVEELISNQWLSEGNVHLFRQQYQEALEAFERAIYFKPNNGLAYIGRGQALNQLASDVFIGEHIYDKALKAFTQAISLDPTNADAYIGKGQTLLEKSIEDSMFGDPHFSDKDEILDAFSQALRLDPENEAAYLGIGDTFTHFKDYEKAEEAYRKPLEFGVFTDVDAYAKMGNVLQKLKRYDEAVEFYDVCIKQNIQSVGLYQNLGKSLRELERYDEALKYYDKALPLTSKYAQTSGGIYIQKGQILYILKKNEECLDAFGKALQLLPNYAKSEKAEAHRGKGTILQFLANREFQSADDLEPSKDLSPLGDLQNESVEKLQDELPDWENIQDDHPF